MKSISISPSRWRRRLPASLAFAWVVFSTAALSLAESPYLAPDQPDGIALLAPPPAMGSAEEAADLASARAVFQGRSAAEETRAMQDASLAFSIFAPAVGPAFQLQHLPRTRALLEKVKAEIGSAIDTPKNHWQRQRPYQMDKHLWLGNPEPSFSYPSGHSTRGTVYALLLAELCPQNRQAILQTGRDIGWDRVLIGKHFPTDVYAGRVLGQAIFRALRQSPAFGRDLAEAKAELQQAIAAQRAEAPNQPAAGKDAR